MSSPTAARLLRHASRNTSRWTLRAPRIRRQSAILSQSCWQTQRCFSISTRRPAGLMPDTHDPQPPKSAEEHRPVQQATELEEEEYHQKADEYLEIVHEQAEKIQEGRGDVEVEYSAGVLSISLPPAGTYILNKQPPNKQIWLSSPTSGPKRFDYVLQGESMDQKEGGGSGDWVYLRDGTSLTELLRKEVGVDVHDHVHEQGMQQSVDQTE